jgi:alkaline phosphatase D
MVGAVTENSAKVCGRLTDFGGVRVKYSEHSNLQGAKLSSSVSTQASSDFTFQVEVDALKAETTYYYSFVIDGVEMPRPRFGYPHFRTFPVAGAVRDFRIAVIADASRNNVNGAPILEEVGAANAAFVVQLGDFDHGDPAAKQPISIQNWRVMHRAFSRGSRAGNDYSRSIKGAYPVFAMWDDHDYGGNNEGKDAPWKAIATQAFREYYPLPPQANPQAGLWYRFSYAQVDFFMLDLRSQRDDRRDDDNADKSMLDGSGLANNQKEWLFSELASSTAVWKVVFTTVPFNPTVQKWDSWTSYQTEAQEILDFIASNEIEGVILVSGDIHTGGGIDNGLNSGLPEMSVPHCNLPDMGGAPCTAVYCGDWSEGSYSGSPATPGFGWIDFSFSAKHGDQAELNTATLGGMQHLSLTLTPSKLDP